MACCAFGLFVLGQIAAGLMALRRVVPLPFLPAPSGAAPLNPNTSWQLHGPPAEAPQPARGPRGGRLGRKLVLVGLLELALVAAGAGLALDAGAAGEGAGARAALAGWCGTPPSEASEPGEPFLSSLF